MSLIQRSKKELLGTAAVMVALSPVALQNAQAATVQVDASAVVRQAVNLVQLAAMDFGSLSETSAGTVTLNFADGVAQGTGGLRPVGGSTSSGRVNVTGQASANVLVTSSAATFKLDNGGTGANNELTVKDITFRLAGQSGATVSATLPATGNVMDIGAKLESSGNQVPGTYSGNFTVSVVYP